MGEDAVNTAAEDTATDTAAEAAATDGGDVAEGREPDAIQREIEQTRAELAETIDAIADRISPKRAASRGAAKVRNGVQSVLSREDSGPPASVLDASPAAAAGPARAAGPAEIEAAVASGGTAFTGTTEFETRRVLRTDRVLLVGGGAAALVALIVLLRRRRG